jgi:outer membrane protein
MSRLMLGVLLAALFLPTLVAAQTAAQPPATPTSAAIAPAKLAWINVDQAILTCDEGTKLYAEIQKFIEDKNVDLDTLRKDADNLKNQLNVQGPKLTDEARLDLEEKADAKDTALQRFQQDTQKEINGRRDRMTNYLGKRMLPVIEKVAEAKSLDAILFFNAQRDAYVNPALNVTEEVVKAYNQAYPVSAAKPPAK